MKALALFVAILTFSICIVTFVGGPVHAEEAVPGAMMMDMGDASSGSEHGSMPMGAQAPQATQPQEGGGQASFDELKKLFGKWEAPLPDKKTIVDTFQPFAFGQAILAEEWVGGQQVTSTVFYMVGSELRADHYCDYLNQPRYVAQPSADPSIIDLAFREATNLDSHPRHFHSTTWRVVDATHMTQDWDVEGGPKGKAMVHLDFVRTE